MGSCPACPGGGGRGRCGLVLVRFLSPAQGHKVLYAHALSSWSGWVDPGIPLLLPTGPRSSSLMISWVPGSLASCCLFLAAVLGRCKGQLKNRHPKARHSPDWSAVVLQRRTLGAACLLLNPALGPGPLPCNLARRELRPHQREVALHRPPVAGLSGVPRAVVLANDQVDHPCRLVSS